MLSTIRSHPAYQQLLSDLRASRKIPGLALPRSARLPILAALVEDLNRQILFVTHRSDHALTIVDELGFWAPNIKRLLFPEPTPLFYELAAWGSATRRDRIQVIKSLGIYHLPGVNKPGTPPLLVAPARALMTRTLPRRDFLINCKLIRVGQTFTQESLLRHWVDIGYQSVDTVLEPGQFSRRGGILDIWPSADISPARLDFFGDEIDTIRNFDPATQRTVMALDALLVTPAREFLPGKANKLGLAGQELSEFQIPLIHPVPSSLVDYLPKDAIVLVDDLSLIESSVTEVEEQAVKMRQESITEGTLPANFPVPYIPWSELYDSLGGYTFLELGRSSAEGSSDLAQAFQPGPRFGGRIKQFMDYLVERLDKETKIVILSRQVSRLKELWNEQQREDPGLLVTPDFIEGTLSEGWIFQPADGPQLELLTDSEIFGWERPQPRQQARPTAEDPESAYSDLKPGDWVVHIDHGIGQFVGLVHRTLEGIEREFLCVEYLGEDQLFVPIHQADRLTRYIGPDGQTPTLSRLGGVEWSNTKERVREAVEAVAAELLDLYAKRQVAEGYAFGPDTAWQKELEASFPYMETEDQLRAIGEVKADMEKARPMDRLLCGDVGYGKTEVALRAAFKAVMDGRQVAVLVPTTVLAQQHFETFTQRLAPFPALVEMLSRFRSAKEQDEIIKKLRQGGVDIVIGTHRLLQADVTFKDLGLVIIDEEQRFGVTHKEHLKQLRTEVDVLTLTATPIPRTLYMALTGVRDISNINTPPEERLPIVTHVGPYSPRLVRQAVLRELERGGQVFFVHNRVQTIPAMLVHLRQLVPEARLGIAHGQMPEAELAAVMHKFTHGEIDILLCTSIIESGLDIPNANTLIVDRGDTFGLAQLYQLRGRVGRGAQRAYAYFFRHRRRMPTVEGQERLEIIAENTQLGAGYSIAMRDLEMRGAGEMLGTRQHGYIASVGFHLYTRLLSQAVGRQRHGRNLPEAGSELDRLQQNVIPVSVDLPVEIGIPVAYVADQNVRLKLYRRLADLQNEAEVDAFTEEFIDRFGPFPEAVKNLFFQMRVKLRAERAGLISVGIESDQLVLRYPPLPDGVPSRNLLPLKQEARAGKNAYWLPGLDTSGDWQERLLAVLTELGQGTGNNLPAH